MKRFTDTNLWQKVWFMDLTPLEKTAWFYLKDACDNVGVWDKNFKLAEFIIGKKIDWDELSDKCNGNIIILNNGKWFLPDFCTYQYGQLSEASKPHQSYLKLLKKHGLLDYAIKVERSNTNGAIRKRVTAKVKEYIYNRDDYECLYCGEHGTKETLVIDHIYPIIKGGDSENDNLATSCIHCNSIKHGFTLDECIGRKIFTKQSLHRVYKILYSLKDKDKDKDKGKDKDKDKEKESPKLKKYGEYKHVLLTDEQYEGLKTKVDDVEKWIKILDESIQEKGNIYHIKDFNLAIQKWYKKEIERNGKGKPSDIIKKFEPIKF